MLVHLKFSFKKTMGLWVWQNVEWFWFVLFYYTLYEYTLKTLIWHINKRFDTAYFDLVNRTLIKSIMVAVGMGYGGSPFRTLLIPYLMFTYGICLIWLILVYCLYIYPPPLDVLAHGRFFFNNGEFQAFQLVLIATFGVVDVPLSSCMIVHFVGLKFFGFHLEKKSTILLVFFPY